jgi:nucleotide-binding universal stress UspA family protein
MYRTILIPLENSPADETILRHIRELARLCHSRLVLVHVADGFAARHQDELNLEDSEEIRQDRVYLAQRAEELSRDGFEASFHLARGDPAHEIIEVARKESCDLIAMATHGHGLLKDAILGTVASDVRHRTDVPVLLVRVPA